MLSSVHLTPLAKIYHGWFGYDSILLTDIIIRYLFLNMYIIILTEQLEIYHQPVTILASQADKQGVCLWSAVASI